MIFNNVKKLNAGILVYSFVTLVCIFKALISIVFSMNCIKLLNDSDRNLTTQLFMNWIFVPDILFCIFFLLFFR